MIWMPRPHMNSRVSEAAGMEERAEALIASYHDTLERLWQASLRLHRCSGCAAQDLENKQKVSAAAATPGRAGRCAGVCKDVRATAKPVYLVKRFGSQEGFGFPSFGDVLLVSNLLCAAWDLGMKIMGCAACVEAAMLYDARTAAAEAHQTAVARKPGAVADGCRRCCASPIGLV